VQEGTVEEVMPLYLQENIASQNQQLSFSLPQEQHLPLQVVKGEISSPQSHPQEPFDVLAPIEVSLNYSVYTRVAGYSIVCLFWQEQDVLFLTSDTSENPELLLGREIGDYCTSFTLPVHLKPGHYHIDIQIKRNDANRPIQEINNKLHIEVDILNQSEYHLSYRKKNPGKIATPIHWQTTKISSNL
jgi:hypothetical protein